MTFFRTHDVTVLWTRSLSRPSSRKLQLDLVLAFLLACGVFYVYARTLVPSVLDGDQGEFQYIPAVLGIPHPSGFPLYLLLGRLWSALPIGTLAYRMNLLSAFFGALTVGALYLALRSQKLLLIASLGASLTLALIPQFWEYSTVAAVYRLHDFLIVLLFAFLAQWEAARSWHWLELAALAFGLDLANHLTIFFFAPATLVLVLMVSGRVLFKELRVVVTAGLLLLLPLVLYAYFPLRGLQLLSNDFILPGWNLAVAQGIVSPFYDGSPSGLAQYFVGGTFFENVTSHLQWRWDTFIPDWTGIILQTVNWQVVALSLIGVVWLALRRAKIAIWLILVVVTFQLIALQYSYAGLAAIGQFSSYFSEYYLPSFIAMIILAAWGMDGAMRGLPALASRVGVRSQMAASSFSALILAAFFVFTVTGLTAHRSDALAARSVEIQAKWDSVQRFPPDQGAALVGHWGDLTPLWYYQYAENWRRDLVTINPPDQGRVDAWIATGKPLYIAGSLLGWAPGIAQKYHLTPWGSLVRVTLERYAPASPLTHEADWTFEAYRPMLKLSGYDVSPIGLRVGENLDLTVYWQVLQSMRIDDAAIYVSLGNAQDDTRTQSYAPVVNWLPGGQLAAGQRALGTYSYTVPWGTHPGTYQLHLSVYATRGGKTLKAVTKDRSLTAVDLGQVIVKPALYYPTTAMTDHPANADFGNRVVLLGWDGDLGQVTQGDTPSVQLLWKAVNELHVKLMAALDLENANTTRPLGEEPLSKSYSSENWRPDEIVQGTRSFSVPADMPEGDYALVLRVADAGQDTRLVLFNGWFPRGDSYTLAQVHVVGRTRSFVVPIISHPQTANFGGRISMLGYAFGSTALHGGDSVHLTLYWKGQSLMSTSDKFFLHLVDGEGNLLAQHDDIPGGGASPTTGWLPGEVVTDSFDLPIPGDLVPGTYQIQAGFYDAVTGERLNVLDSNGVATKDYVVLQDSLEVTTK